MKQNCPKKYCEMKSSPERVAAIKTEESGCTRNTTFLPPQRGKPHFMATHCRLSSNQTADSLRLSCRLNRGKMTLSGVSGAKNCPDSQTK